MEDILVVSACDARPQPHTSPGRAPVTVRSESKLLLRAPGNINLAGQLHSVRITPTTPVLVGSLAPAPAPVSSPTFGSIVASLTGVIGTCTGAPLARLICDNLDPGRVCTGGYPLNLEPGLDALEDAREAALLSAPARIEPGFSAGVSAPVPDLVSSGAATSIDMPAAAVFDGSSLCS